MEFIINVTFYLTGKLETAVIIYSSGTTGVAKGAKITHVNMIVTSQQPKLVILWFQKLKKKLSYLNLTLID